ncbi:lipopolysaccharide biosynthesis protein [Pseudarthrobacter chlorophenolicus]|uniref:lipopolysaccharide biosynthesis protein n=1 Tax=Pseudarthrobacter chlorophenolicus TaxID=85085 RepID=UPI0013791810|nr:oligosaccharide flippase family protein [Pseudarthrobacter chlorophenolicus]
MSAIAVLYSSTIITQQRGIEGFALFAIFISLPYMVPVSDFGISVSVTDTLATKGKESPEFRFVWRRTLTVLCLICLLAVVAAAILAVTGCWSQILGLPASQDTEFAGLLMMTIMALGIPLGAGQRVLLGMGSQTLATVLNSSSGCVSLGLVWLVLQTNPSGYAQLAAAYGAGPLLMQLLVFLIAVRKLGREPWRRRSDQAQTKIRVLKLAVPMAVLSIALPLTYQTDRVLLAHSSDLIQVANYSYVSMYYMPLLSIITVGSQALWPLFMRNLKNPRRLQRQYKRADKLFLGISAAMMAGLILLGPVATQIVSNNAGSAPLVLYVVFGVMLLLFGVNATSGMLLMDYSGRKIQATGAVVMLATKVPLSLLLIPTFGATGAVAATLLPLFLCMVMPTKVVALRRIKKGISK